MPREAELLKALEDSLHTHQSTAVLSDSLSSDFTRYSQSAEQREETIRLIRERSDAMISKLLNILREGD